MHDAEAVEVLEREHQLRRVEPAIEKKNPRPGQKLVATKLWGSSWLRRLVRVRARRVVSLGR